MKMLIGNHWEDAARNFKVINPYTNEVINTVPIASKEQINRALELAYMFKCTLSGAERAQLLKRTAGAIESGKNEIASLITAESGLCLKHSLYEVKRALNTLKQAAMQAEVIDNIDPTQEFMTHADPQDPKLTVITEPWDLIVGITPFNHPLNLVVHKVAPALVTGTAMVLKPSEKTPLTALKLGEILVQNGLPPNMINIVTGMPPKEIVDQLVSYPKLDVVSFTGGVQTGRYIAKKMANSGNELKKYVPELGGNAAFVVLEDCDVQLAAKIAMGAFDNSGQRCTAIKRIFIQETIANNFLGDFVERVKKIKYGNPMDPETDMGTVINEEQSRLIQKRVDNAVCNGSKLLLGNERKGALYAPTIVDHVDPCSELAALETFGPVVSIIRVKSLDHIIEILKKDSFGLAAAIATSCKENAIVFQNSISVGQFSWNGPPGYRTEEAPFGGFKDSGNGEKEGIIMSVKSFQRIRTFYEH